MYGPTPDNHAFKEQVLQPDKLDESSIGVWNNQRVYNYQTITEQKALHSTLH